jgi:hypothetical protein
MNILIINHPRYFDIKIHEREREREREKRPRHIAHLIIVIFDSLS